MHVVVWIATGLAAGWIARVVLRRRRHGVLVDLSLGLLGALVGGALTRQLGIAVEGPGAAQVVVGTLGAVVLVGVARLLGHLVERAGYPGGSERLRTVVHDLEAQIGRLGDVERGVLLKMLRREPVARDAAVVFDQQRTFGDIVADRMAAVGGSWTFIGIFLCGMTAWIIANARADTPFDPFPFILLNLALSCLAALQAPVIMMSQNRQAAKDRVEAHHDYEVNLKAELEILALHSKLDELRDRHWRDLVALQEEQLALLRTIAAGNAGAGG